MSYLQRFDDPRTENDVNLVEIISSMLLRNLGIETDISAFTNNPDIQDARNRRPDAQRYIINQFFTVQLSSLDVDTMRARQALLRNGDISLWLEYFEAYVIPYCVDFNLPKDLYAQSCSC